jgi:hypothetical protein
MSRYAWQVRKGPIPGLRLPHHAWTVLERDNITTLDQLKAVADRIERIPGAGSKTAEAIRAELARVMASEQHSPDEDQLSNP